MEKIVETLEEKIYRLIDKVTDMAKQMNEKDAYINELEKQILTLQERDEQNKEKISKLVDTINNLGL